MNWRQRRRENAMSDMRDNKKMGLAILISMQIVCFVCVFFSMFLLDRNAGLPEEPGVVWALVSSLGLLFPLVSTHFYLMFWSRKIGWFSWWLTLFSAFGGLLLALGNWIGEHNGGQEQVTTFYISAVLGGSLGVLSILAPVRYFSPRMLDYRPSDEIKTRRFGIKTIFLWITAAAIGTAIYLNAENLFIELFPKIN
ncbi:MAG: hypothetical protein AAGA30_12190, partial [Planctomycetota bacterium]